VLRKTHEEVNTRTYSILKNTKKTLDRKFADEYHYQYLSDKIEKFLSGELEVDYQEEITPPDGSPIGSHDYLLFSCGSEL